ncbi:MAG: hypothetical protein HZB16_24115 [Armatimonadetes bacterium]|nr:hypothetical protein [Armatimonadota bacterium]
MASSELAGQELACALCGEVTLVPGTHRPAQPGLTAAPAGYRRERYETDPRRYRTEAHPIWIGLLVLLTSASMLAVSASGKSSQYGVLGWAISESVIVGLSWATWMRGGNWWANVLFSWLLTPLAGAIHAWTSTSDTERLADPDRRSYPVLIICTLLSILATLFVLLLIVAVFAILLVVIAAIAGQAPMPRH